jgi:hypothetical protein
MNTEKLMELFASLGPENVDEFGDEGYLDLPQSEIDRIQKDYRSPTQRKEAYLDLYVHQHPCPTWSRVAEVLCRIRLLQQADLVENTYIKGTCTQDIHVHVHVLLCIIILISSDRHCM